MNLFPCKYYNYIILRFPKDIELKNKWIKAVRRENWSPSERSVLCSTHFVEDCFNRTLSLTRLRSDAVPTIFLAFSSYLQQPVQKQRRQLKRKLFVTEELSQAVDSQPSTSSSVPHQKHEEVGKLTSVPESWRKMISRTTSFSPERKHRSESPRIARMR
ncbi:hypothetical protein ILUMI_20350, partial [Ignelater luminosus]